MVASENATYRPPDVYKPFRRFRPTVVTECRCEQPESSIDISMSRVAAMAGSANQSIPPTTTDRLPRKPILGHRQEMSIGIGLTRPAKIRTGEESTGVFPQSRAPTNHDFAVQSPASVKGAKTTDRFP